MDQDPLFILAPEDSLYDPKHAIPMATYAEITAFDEPQMLFTLFEQGDLDFKLVSEGHANYRGVRSGSFDRSIASPQSAGKIIGGRISNNASKTNGPKIWVSSL